MRPGKLSGVWNKALHADLIWQKLSCICTALNALAAERLELLWMLCCMCVHVHGTFRQVWS